MISVQHSINIESSLIHLMNIFICLQANIYIDNRFNMHIDGNVFKIKGFCFKFIVIYLMTMSLSSTFKRNVFFALTKILANAPLNNDSSLIIEAC